MTASHGWRLLNTFYRYEVNLVWVLSGWEVLIISYSMSPGRNLLKIPRLHFPVSGISISWSPFFIPARIPQDSSGSGFLFFPEEFFYRNLLLAGLRNPEVLRNLRNTPEFLFPLTKTTVIWRKTMAWGRRLRGNGPYHGLWWTYALNPVYRRDPDITGDAATCWVEGIRPPQPERFRYFGGYFLYA